MSDAEAKLRVQVNPAASHPGESAVAPLVDIYETQDGTVVLVAEVPGANAAKTEVSVDKGVLTIRADGRLPDPPPTHSRLYTGFTGGEYFRAFALSDEVDRDRIEASVQNGLLTVRLPRAAAAQTRKIPIKTA